MAKFSLSFGKTGKGKGSINAPSAKWVRENKHTARFKKLVKSAWSSYLLLLNGFYAGKWAKAPERKNSSGCQKHLT